MDIQSQILFFLVLLSGSFVIPFLAVRARIPSAVLLIGYGILIGPEILNVSHNADVLHFIYELGFVILMFLAGMEIDFNNLKKIGNRYVKEMFIICCLIFFLAFAPALLSGHHPLYGLVLGAVSIGLPAAVLRESDVLPASFTGNIITLGSLGEFLTVVALAVFYFVAKYGLSFALLGGIGKLSAVLIIALLVLRFLLAVSFWWPEKFSKFMDKDNQHETGIRGALLLAVAFSALVTLAGLESIVGAFIAGALISFIFRGKAVLEQKLVSVGQGIFVPLFFIGVGIRFNPQVINRENLWLTGAGLLIIFGLRFLPSLILLRGGKTMKEIVGISLMLSAPLTLIIAISEVGIKLNILKPPQQGALILLAIATGIVFPILFRFLKIGQGQGDQVVEVVR